MRNFLLRLLVFLFVMISVFSVVSHFILASTNFLSRRLIWYYVYERVLRSQETISGDTLYLGDSVGNQFFPFDKNPNSLTTNAGVLMVGQYILAENAIRANPQISHINMIMVPNSLGWNWERPTTFNNFVKPFLCFSHVPYFSPLVYSHLSSKPLSYLGIFEFAKLLGFFQLDLTGTETMQDEYLSDLAKEYLMKLAQLCKQEGIDLQFFSPPVPERRFQSSRNWKVLRNQIDSLGLKDIFGEYLDHILYLPESYFRDDIHLTPDYLNAHREEIIRDYLIK
jgi:hypothetical protein